jgi:putative methionine-R-sulfoxide reductase with GAF domain
MPISAEETAVGELVVAATEPRAFDDADEAFLRRS